MLAGLRSGLEPGHLLGLTPEAATLLITATCSSIASMVVAIINAIRTREITRQVVPPSNGQTLASAIESVQATTAPTEAPNQELVARIAERVAAAQDVPPAAAK